MEFFIIDLNVLNLLYDKNKGTIPFTTKKTQKLWRNITSFNQRSQFRKKKGEHGLIVWLPVCVKNCVIKSKILLEHCSLSSKIKSNNCHSFQSMPKSQQDPKQKDPARQKQWVNLLYLQFASFFILTGTQN